MPPMNTPRRPHSAVCATEAGHRSTVDRAVLALAGSLVLISTLLSLLVSPWWSAATLFVGANLLQSSVTGFCPAEILLRRVLG